MIGMMQLIWINSLTCWLQHTKKGEKQSAQAFESNNTTMKSFVFANSNFKAHLVLSRRIFRIIVSRFEVKMFSFFGGSAIQGIFGKIMTYVEFTSNAMQHWRIELNVGEEHFKCNQNGLFDVIVSESSLMQNSTFANEPLLNMIISKWSQFQGTTKQQLINIDNGLDVSYIFVSVQQVHVVHSQKKM